MARQARRAGFLRKGEQQQQLPTCRRSVMTLRIWGLAKPCCWARRSVASSIRRCPLCGLIASAAVMRAKSQRRVSGNRQHKEAEAKCGNRKSCWAVGLCVAKMVKTGPGQKKLDRFSLGPRLIRWTAGPQRWTVGSSFAFPYPKFKSQSTSISLSHYISKHKMDQIHYPNATKFDTSAR